eukprot:1152834-Pelagomonas_calceolata.AAC.3
MAQRTFARPTCKDDTHTHALCAHVPLLPAPNPLLKTFQEHVPTGASPRHHGFSKRMDTARLCAHNPSEVPLSSHR